jgi:hypothetical protein
MVPQSFITGAQIQKNKNKKTKQKKKETDHTWPWVRDSIGMCALSFAMVHKATHRSPMNRNITLFMASLSIRP